MNFYLILGLVFGILGIVLMVFLVIISVLFIIGLFQGWNKSSKQRQANAEAGALLEEFPKKGGGSARFYETGLVLDVKRVPYDTLTDVFFDEGSPERGADLKEAIQNSAVLWLYRKGGFHRTLGVRDFVYGFDHEDCRHIKDGLGFRDDA